MEAHGGGGGSEAARPRWERRGHKPRAARSSQELEEARESFF